MAKIIKLTPDCLTEIRKDFEAALAGAKLSDGKISFTKSFGTIQRKATVYFSEVAWLKMQTLIREFDKEVAWHGLAYRGEDPEKDEYIIKDILVYPQEVTGATVTTDQAKYQTWLMEHDDDVFNNIRMQGHSHVNMGTTPSGVDTSLYTRILDQLDDTMFYIFLIYNKRGEKTYKIYDLAKNVMFETLDVTVKVMDDGLGLNAFLADAKSKVQDRVYTPNYTKPAVYGGGTPGAIATTKPAATVPASPAKPVEEKKAEDKKESGKSSGNFSKGKRKGKRKGHNKTTNFPRSSSSPYAYDDDDNDIPYGSLGYRGNPYRYSLYD